MSFYVTKRPIIVKFKPMTEKLFFYSKIIFIVSKPSRSIQNFNFSLEAWQARNSFESLENDCSSLWISCFFRSHAILEQFLLGIVLYSMMSLFKAIFIQELQHFQRNWYRVVSSDWLGQSWCLMARRQVIFLWSKLYCFISELYYA